MVPSVKFLREYHVNAEGRQPRDEEIGGINGAETRFYLGLINRYGNFMPNPSKKLLRIGVKWASTESLRRLMCAANLSLWRTRCLCNMMKRRNHFWHLITLLIMLNTQIVKYVESESFTNTNGNEFQAVNRPRTIFYHLWL